MCCKSSSCLSGEKTISVVPLLSSTMVVVIPWGCCNGLVGRISGVSLTGRCVLAAAVESDFLAERKVVVGWTYALLMWLLLLQGVKVDWSLTQSETCWAYWLRVSSWYRERHFGCIGVVLVSGWSIAWADDDSRSFVETLPPFYCAPSCSLVPCSLALIQWWIF